LSAFTIEIYVVYQNITDERQSFVIDNRDALHTFTGGVKTHQRPSSVTKLKKYGWPFTSKFNLSPFFLVGSC